MVICGTVAAVGFVGGGRVVVVEGEPNFNRLFELACESVGGKVDVLRHAQGLIGAHRDVIVRVQPGNQKTACHQLAVSQLLVDSNVPVVVGTGRPPVASDDGFVVSFWVRERLLPTPPTSFHMGQALAALSSVAPPASLGVSPIVKDNVNRLKATLELVVEKGDTEMIQAADVLSRMSSGMEQKLRLSMLSDVDGVGLMHGDLHYNNLLATSRGWVLADLEWAGRGPRCFDAHAVQFRAVQYTHEVDLVQVVHGFNDSFLSQTHAFSQFAVPFAPGGLSGETFDAIPSVSQVAVSPSAIIYAWAVAVGALWVAAINPSFRQEALKRAAWFSGQDSRRWEIV